MSFGSIGTGSLGHLAVAQIGGRLGSEWTHVPCRGGGPPMIDAVAEQVPLAIGTVFLVDPHVRSGKVKALAVTSRKPGPSLPGAAPLVDQGVPGCEALAWWNVFAPAGTPRPIVRRRHEALAKALKVPSVAERLTGQGMEIVGGGPEELDRFVRVGIDRWAKVLRDNEIKAGD